MLLSEAKETLETGKKRLEILKKKKEELKEKIGETKKERGKKLEKEENDFHSRKKIEGLEEELEEAKARVFYLEEDGVDSAKEQLENLQGKLEDLEISFQNIFEILKNLTREDIEVSEITDLPNLVNSIKQILLYDDVDIPDSPVAMESYRWKQEFVNWLNSQNLLNLAEKLELPEPDRNVDMREDEVFEIFFPVTSDRNLIKMQQSSTPTNRNEDLMHYWKERGRSAEEKVETWLENDFKYSRERDWEATKESS